MSAGRVEMMRRNLREMEGDQPGVIVFGGSEYPCLLGASEAGVTIDPHSGNTIEYSQKIFLRKEQFEDGGWPDVGRVIKVNQGARSVDRKVKLVTELEEFVELYLIDVGK